MLNFHVDSVVEPDSSTFLLLTPARYQSYTVVNVHIIAIAKAKQLYYTSKCTFKITIVVSSLLGFSISFHYSINLLIVGTNLHVFISYVPFARIFNFSQDENMLIPFRLLCVVFILPNSMEWYTILVQVDSIIHSEFNLCQKLCSIYSVSSKLVVKRVELHRLVSEAKLATMKSSACLQA